MRSDYNITCIKTKFEFNNEKDKEEIEEIIKEYNRVFYKVFSYFQSLENHPTRKFLYELFQNKTINTFLPTQVWNSIFQECKTLSNCLKFSEFKGELKNRPLLMIGAKGTGNTGLKGNRYFHILNENQISFVFNRSHKYILNIKADKNIRNKLIELKNLQDQKKIALTYSVDLNQNISISYKVDELSTPIIPIKDRILSIDLNPNYIGVSVVDWKSSITYNVIEAFIIDLSELNKKSNLNKRINELKEIMNFLIRRAIYLRCEVFSMENLKIQSKNHNKGSNVNFLINSIWNRSIFKNTLQIQCTLHGIKFLKAPCHYSSLLGNLCFRETKLPDPILASIEISRRNYEFYHQFILKDKQINKNICFNTEYIDKINESLKELNISILLPQNSTYKDVKNLYNKLKDLNIQYRSPLRKSEEVFRLKSYKSKVNICKF